MDVRISGFLGTVMIVTFPFQVTFECQKTQTQESYSDILELVLIRPAPSPPRCAINVAKFAQVVGAPFRRKFIQKVCIATEIQTANRSGLFIVLRELTTLENVGASSHTFAKQQVLPTLVKEDQHTCTTS